MDVVIRVARLDEVGRLGEVERDGDQRFAGYGGVPAGFDGVTAPSTLEEAQGESRLWVARWGKELWERDFGGVGRETGSGSGDGEIIGFALAEVIEGCGHLGQVSVREDRQGQGVGRKLIETVCQWAREKALGAVTLCTFADVEWNRPLYEHLGFVVLPEENWSPGLRAVFESDGELGLDLSRRVVMRFELEDG